MTTIPAGGVSNSNLNSGSGTTPRDARSDLLDLVNQYNQLISSANDPGGMAVLDASTGKINADYLPWPLAGAPAGEGGTEIGPVVIDLAAGNLGLTVRAEGAAGAEIRLRNDTDGGISNDDLLGSVQFSGDDATAGDNEEMAKIDGVVTTVGASWDAELQLYGGDGGALVKGLTVGGAGLTAHLPLTMQDDDWIGLGAAAGRIVFDDQATDEINFMDCDVGIGTDSPGATTPSGWSATSARILEVRSAGLTADAGIFALASNGSRGLQLWADNSTADVYLDNRGDTPAADIFFRVRTAGTPVDVLRLNSAGATINGVAESVNAGDKQLRLTQDAGVDYADFEVDGSGDLTITPSGSTVTIDGDLAVTGSSPGGSPQTQIVSPGADYTITPATEGEHETVWVDSGGGHHCTNISDGWTDGVRMTIWSVGLSSTVIDAVAGQVDTGGGDLLLLSDQHVRFVWEAALSKWLLEYTTGTVA